MENIKTGNNCLYQPTANEIMKGTAFPYLFYTKEVPIFFLPVHGHGTVVTIFLILIKFNL